jgi:hypothetical protein
MERFQPIPYFNEVLGDARQVVGYSNSLLGVSAHNRTIFFTCLVDDSASYDDFGRLVTIESGRLTVEGSLRNRILDIELYRFLRPTEMAVNRDKTTNHGLR